MIKEKDLLYVIFFALLLAIIFYAYKLGKKHTEEKPPQIIIEYIDDRCLCIKCGKRVNFQEVQYLIQELK